ncbi:MAG: hypothetical protein HWQ38_00795 [Nostoc sp. NMS7]|uniref:hypothetical protein n=1 Tax=Nostoc sp. NMS7 TaxID=2815391 RepID=UPI0025D57918|nr:hypothetical protein [Nostoc sp. NMS7]MBN3945096.1 hypothetical protein [Nostoc sp. NMS7]
MVRNINSARSHLHWFTTFQRWLNFSQMTDNSPRACGTGLATALPNDDGSAASPNLPSLPIASAVIRRGGLDWQLRCLTTAALPRLL